MEVKAKLRFLRISPKKVRLVTDVIRGAKTEQAVSQLGFVNKIAAKPILKLLNSAVANAVNNFDLKKDNLYIKEIRVDQAGMLKRWLPRAHGRATPIRKKMAHVCIVLDEITPSVKKVKKVKKAAKEAKPVRISSLKDFKESPEVKKLVAKDKTKSKEHDKEADKEIQDVRMEGKHRHKQHEEKRQMKGKKGFMQKIFNRKSG